MIKIKDTASLKLCLKLFFIIIGVVKSDNNCTNDMINEYGRAVNIDSDNICKTGDCITKCCDRYKYLILNGTEKTCSYINDDEFFLDNKVIIENIAINNVTQDVKRNFYFGVYILKNRKFQHNGCKIKNATTTQFKITQNGLLVLDDGRRIFYSSKDYCLERFVEGKTKGFIYFYTESISKNKSLTTKNVTKTAVCKNEYTDVNGKNINVTDYCKDFYTESTSKNKSLTTKKVTKTAVCKNEYTDVNGKNINVTDYCKGGHCIAKCCAQQDRIMYYDQFNNQTLKCVSISDVEKNSNTTLHINYSRIKVYKNIVNRKLDGTELNLEKDFRFIKNKKLAYSPCASDIKGPMAGFHLLENNSLIWERPNYYRRFIHNWNMGDFCIEHVVIRNMEGKVQDPYVIYRYNTVGRVNTADANSMGEMEDLLKAIAMLVSCLFLLLVLFVYGAIRELRNLVGMILMAYVSTLAVTFFAKAVMLLAVYKQVMDSHGCKRMGVFVYYAAMSTFFWMNTMSLDIWWTFRGMAKSRPIHRRGELVKFCMYALYAWGVPLLVTIAVGVVDFIDLSHVPDFFTPHFESCFQINDNLAELKYYLYLPIFILMIADWIFFLMTAFNIWRIKRCMAKFTNEANKYNNNQNRFGLYLKLSLVMGISWVLEVVQLPWWLEAVATAYNCLIGVAIFFIFVFKRKVLFKLCKRFGIQSNFVENLQRNYSKYSTTGTISVSERKRSDVETMISST